jgi:hypothetical protein
MQWLGTSKYTIFLIVLRFQNLWNLINVLKNNLWKCSFTCFLWFFKIKWVQENQGVTFLVVPPKDGLAQMVFSSRQTFKKIPFAKQGY